MLSITKSVPCAIRRRCASRRGLILAVCLHAMFGAHPHPAGAQQSSWKLAPPTEGDWHDAANWTNGVPNQFRDGLINNKGFAHLGEGVAAAHNVIVGNTSEGTLRISGGSLMLPQILIVGQATAAEGRLEMSGGELSALTVTIGEFGQGVFDLSGGAVNVGRIWVGFYGDGRVNHSGGVLDSSGPVQIAGGDGGDGRYVVNGADAELLADLVNIGGADAGMMEQSAGFVQVVNDLVLGGQGSYLLHGMGELSARRMYVNGETDRIATFTQNQGLADIEVYVGIGTDMDTVGQYTLSGGELRTAELVVGVSGQGHFAQHGGMVAADEIRIGHHNLGLGEYQMIDGSLRAGSLRVGIFGPASFVQHGGMVDVDFLRMEAPTFTPRYEMHGGSLVVRSRIEAAGVLDFTDAPVTLSVDAGAVIDLTAATIVNGSQARFETGAGSIVLLPPGADLSALFHEVELFESMVYISGTTFHVQAGQVVTLGRDFQINDHALIEGTLKPDGELYFNKGLSVAAGGVVDLGGEAIVRVENQISGVEGGVARLFNLNVGHNLPGTFQQDGGEVDVRNVLRIGQWPGGNGVYQFLDGTLRAKEVFVGGQNGFGGGELHQSGGVAEFERLTLGLQSHGLYELGPGAQARTDRLTVGERGQGEFHQGGGSMTVMQSMFVGRFSGGNGVYTLEDGVLTALEGTVGDGAMGEVEQSGGSFHILGTLRLADSGTTAQGTYRMESGELVADRIFLGTDGTGIFEHRGGTVMIYRDLNVGQRNRGIGGGLYDLSDQGLLTTDATVVGQDKLGEFRQTGGAHVVNRLIIGQYGSYEFSGGVLEVESQLTIHGLMDLSGQTVTIPLQGVIALLAPGVFANAQAATITLDEHSLLIHQPGDDPTAGFGTVVNAGLTHQAGTTLVIPQDRHIRGAGEISDPVTIHGSLVAEGPLALLGPAQIMPPGTLDLGPHTLVVANEDSGMSGGTMFVGTLHIPEGPAYQFMQSAGSAAVDNLIIELHGVYTLSGGSLSVSRHVRAEGSVDFADGDAVLHAKGRAFIDLAAGSVLGASNATLRLDAESLVSLPEGFDPPSQIGTIEGEGFVHIAGDTLVIPEGRALFPFGRLIGAVDNAGVLSPGDGPELLAIAGAYDQHESGSLLIEIDGRRELSRTTIAMDRLTADEITLAGELDVRLLNDFVPKMGEMFTIVTSPQVGGRFANAHHRLVLDEGLFEVVYLDDRVQLQNFHASMALGDLNGDGLLDAFDTSVFEMALADGQAYLAMYPELDPHLLGDFDDNGVLDAFDVASFEAALAALPAPEPATLALLSIGGLLMARRRSGVGW